MFKLNYPLKYWHLDISVAWREMEINYWFINKPSGICWLGLDDDEQLIVGREEMSFRRI